MGAVGGEGGLDRGERIVRAAVGLVEVREIDPRLGGVLHRDLLAELGLGGCEVVVGDGDAREKMMGGLGEARHHACGEGPGLVKASADDEGRGHVVLAEVIERGDVGRIQLHCAGEVGLDLAGEGETGDGAGVAGLHAVGAAEPKAMVAGLGLWAGALETASSHSWIAGSAASCA